MWPWSTTPACTTGTPHGLTPRCASMKSSKVEVMKRVEEVFKLRLGGAEFADIREYAAAPEQSWHVSDSQLWRYVAAADKLAQQRFDAKAEHLLSRHLLQRRQVFAH